MLSLPYYMSRINERINIISSSIGTERFINVYKWGKPGRRAYIQSSLHADEYPGLLVANHLAKLLDEANSKNEIEDEIVIVPFANPIGLSQNVLESHLGRFCLESGTNFNRSWSDTYDAVSAKISGYLTPNADENIKLIRNAILEELKLLNPLQEDAYLKNQLLQLACVADVSLDLHCDCVAVMHMYTHNRLWPELSDLARYLQSHCQILDSNSGGNCFDEACMNIWSKLADKFPEFPIPMACHACTVELRGEHDVRKISFIIIIVVNVYVSMISTYVGV